MAVLYVSTHTDKSVEWARAALRRLEALGLIAQGPSRSNGPGKRPTHTYRLTAKGRELLENA